MASRFFSISRRKVCSVGKMWALANIYVRLTIKKGRSLTPLSCVRKDFRFEYNNFAAALFDLLMRKLSTLSSRDLIVSRATFIFLDEHVLTHLYHSSSFGLADFLKVISDSQIKSLSLQGIGRNVVGISNHVFKKEVGKQTENKWNAKGKTGHSEERHPTC